MGVLPLSQLQRQNDSVVRASQSHYCPRVLARKSKISTVAVGCFVLVSARSLESRHLHGQFTSARQPIECINIVYTPRLMVHDADICALVCLPSPLCGHIMRCAYSP